MTEPTKAEQALIGAMYEAKDKFNAACQAVDDAGLGVRLALKHQAAAPGRDEGAGVYITDLYKYAWRK